MGDLVGIAVTGNLYFIRAAEFTRVRSVKAPAHEVTALFADMARLNTLYMIATAGSGHIGSSFSSMDLFAYLQLHYIDQAKGHIFFSSKGHDAPGLYAILMAAGALPENLIDKLRRLDGLPGHPDVGTEGIVANTGSLGMGISKAKGLVLASRLKGKPIKVAVVTGDGELQEGQIWESLVSAANWKMDELTVVVDHNKIQSDYSLDRTSSLGDLPKKFAAFGWHVERIDGHNVKMIGATFENLRSITDKPKVIIADTVKGKGVSFMEGTSIDSDVEMFQFHSGAPRSEDYTKAAQELLDKINRRAKSVIDASIEVETVTRFASVSSSAPTQTLIPAYSEALLAAAARRGELVALDADLVKDMGLVAFTEKYPERFFECGIAEQDMVSIAGGMARAGLLPVVHSFSCFLSTRPNEQIYNNATERSKIVYVGGLSGILPAGPGHSHQSVREISAVGGMPGMVMVAPSCVTEVRPLLDWCIETHDGPSFFRLVSIPVEVNFELPEDYTPRLGRGISITRSGDVLLIGSGPTLLSQAVAAATLLGSSIKLEVVNLPWLNHVDAAWIATVIKDKRLLVTLDDHYIEGGQGEKILAAAAPALGSCRVLQLGLTGIPPSGQPAEVLARVKLDAAAIAQQVRDALKA